MNRDESDDEYHEFVPITLEQFELLKKNSKKKNFLCDYSDQINEEMVLPSLAIMFPKSISNQAKHLKKQLEFLEKDNKNDRKRGNSSEDKRRKSSEKSENCRFSSKKTTSTHNKKEKKESETNSEFSLNEEKPKKMLEKKKEEENLKKLKKTTKKKSSYSSDSSYSSKKQPNLYKRQEMKEDKSSDSRLKKDLEESVLHANACSDSEEDDTRDLEKGNIISCLPKDFDKKKEKGLALKFKLCHEVHFYITHSRTKELRKRIANYISSQGLTYSITELDKDKTKAFFVLEAVNKETKEKLQKSHKLLKQYLKKDLSFESCKLAPKDFHAFKKIFHTKSEDNKFVEVSFLKFRHERDDLVTALAISFDKELIKKMIRFLEERQAIKIGIMRIKYEKFDRNKKRTRIEKRKDYGVLVDEGKLAKRFLEKQKKEIFEKVKKNKKYDCEMTIFESSRKERAYNTSLIFHYLKTEEKHKIKQNHDDLDKFFSLLQQRFHFKLRFFSFLFKNIKSWDDVPHLKEIESEWLFFSIDRIEASQFKLNVFGDPGEIEEFLQKTEIITFFKSMKENSKKIEMILKFNDLDGEGNEDFFKFDKQFPNVIKEAGRYTEEETCNYLLLLFKKDADYSQILQTILKILAKGFPRFEKNNNNNSNRKEKKRKSCSSEKEEEEKRSQKPQKKHSKDEKKASEYMVSDDEI